MTTPPLPPGGNPVAPKTNQPDAAADESPDDFALDRMTQDAWRLFRVMGEFTIGFDRLGALDRPVVTVYGSARTSIKNRYYGLAEALGRELVQHGFAVATGGGSAPRSSASKPSS